MSVTDSQNVVMSEVELELAGRMGRAWREIRRGANTGDLRDVIFGVGGSAIEPGQMDALDFLVTVDSCRMGDLAEHLRIDPSTATRAVQRLIKDNLAERVSHSGDGRIVAIAATERGRRIHGEVQERRRAVLKDVIEAFSEEEREKLVEYLERFSDAVDKAIETAVRAKRRHR
jgi:DNA-binding MarR family transcriptional regulator